MGELQKKKLNIIRELSGLCAHCSAKSNLPHRCPVREITMRVESLNGVPLMVNDEFRGVLFG